MSTIPALGACAMLALVASACTDDAAPVNAADSSDADAAPVDPDSGAPPWSPPVVAFPPEGEPADFRISDVGLYEDLARGQVAPDLIPFEPAYRLWSDGLAKRRWLRLPEGAVIDTSDMDHWQLPVGATLFKDFARDGVVLETRLIARVGAGPRDYWMGAFVWLADGSDAVYAPDGAEDVDADGWDVPASIDCWSCHNGEPGKGLGMSALQLDRDGQLDAFAAAGRLSHAPTADQARVPPGDAVTRAALGYLHANCGHCHNEHGTARPDTDMVLRLSVTEGAPEDTGLYASVVGVPLQSIGADGVAVRVAPGDPDRSGLVDRMSRRGVGGQMPPLGTEHVDADGLAAVRAWIASLADGAGP